MRGSVTGLQPVGKWSPLKQGFIELRFPCRYPGCKKRFSFDTSARRHERMVHHFYRGKKAQLSIRLPLEQAELDPLEPETFVAAKVEEEDAWCTAGGTHFVKDMSLSNHLICFGQILQQFINWLEQFTHSRSIMFLIRKSSLVNHSLELACNYQRNNFSWTSIHSCRVHANCLNTVFCLLSLSAVYCHMCRFWYYSLVKAGPNLSKERMWQQYFLCLMLDNWHLKLWKFPISVEDEHTNKLWSFYNLRSVYF